MEIVTKARDAASMFWEALDPQEKKLLMVYGAYLLGSVLLAVQRSSRERLRREIIAEARGG